MEISRIVFFCDDRKVGIVLRLLTGYAIQTPEVTPVVNAIKKGKKLAAKTNGNLIEMFSQYLKEHKLTEIGSSIGRDYCKSVGMSPASYTYLFNKARGAGILRKTGKGTQSRWKVVNK